MSMFVFVSYHHTGAFVIHCKCIYFGIAVRSYRRRKLKPLFENCNLLYFMTTPPEYTDLQITFNPYISHVFQQDNDELHSAC